MYSKKVMEHFTNPHNYGKMEDADGIGKVGNVKCGDVMVLYIKVDDEKIIDIKFETFGCAAAIASSSIVTDIVKGMKIEDAEKLTKEDVIKGLGDLPPIKVHCSVLAIDGLRKAIKNYREKKK